MADRTEPWYLHIILCLIIAVLVFILVQVAVIQPARSVEREKYYRTESRLRMSNISQAEILWNKKYNRFTNNIDSLISFMQNDSSVLNVIRAIDSTTGKKTNPFIPLLSLKPEHDSIRYFTQQMPGYLKRSPKSLRQYILMIDTTVISDTVKNSAGRIIRIDTHNQIGTRYYIEDPDGYGNIGDLNPDALKNTASWELN